MLLGIIVGAIIAFLSTPLPFGIVFGYLVAGFVAGYLARQGPAKGALAGFVASLAAVVAWSIIAIIASASLLGWPGAILGWGLGMTLLLISACGLCLSALGGAIGGVIAARKRRYE